MLALVPARKGSKGLKDKNIKVLFGKPLIVWTLEALLKSKNITEIIVSTDDPRIINICKNMKIDVPFIRPAYLAQDNTAAINVYEYTLDMLNKNRKEKINEFLVALPTSPLRSFSHVDDAIMLYKKKKAEALISCTQLEFPNEWILNMDKSNFLKLPLNKNILKKKIINRQLLSKNYIPNGAIYILKLNNIKKNKSYYSEKTFLHVMDRISSIDIDDLADFEYAEFLIKRRYKTL